MAGKDRSFCPAVKISLCVLFRLKISDNEMTGVNGFTMNELRRAKK